MGLQVYVEEEAPYYKVRIGDYLSRTKAEADLVILKTRKGYPDAWIAKTMIFSQDR
jgi:hypothetical protein